MDLQRFELAQDRLNRSFYELADTHERLASELARAAVVAERFIAALDASLNKRDRPEDATLLLQPA